MRLLSILVFAFSLLTPGLLPAGEMTAETTAISHLRTLADDGGVGFPEAVEFEARLVLDWKAGKRVRVEQELAGLPVHGGGLVVSLDDDGQVRRMKGEPVDSVLLDRTPRLSASLAEARSQALVYAWFGGEGALFEPWSELVAFIDRDRVAHLAWRVNASTAEPVGNYQLVVDALDGRFLDVQSTLVHARGNVYPTNPVASELAEVDITRLDDSIDGMQGEYAYVSSCTDFEQGWSSTCNAKERYALADADGNFLFDPDPTATEDPLAEVQMYYHLDLVSDWFATEHGFSHPEAIEGLVNFDYDNAFYGNADADPAAEVAFGQSASMDFAYDADVIYHEFGHSVFGSVAGQTGFLGADEYGLEWATGGINEGTADVFALVLTGDPRMGDYAGTGFGMDAIRDLEADRHCPTDLYGEVHADGEVFGSFAWNVMDDPLLGVDFSGDYFWGVVSGLPVDANWMDLSESLAEVGDDMLDAGLIDDAQRARLGELMAAQGLDACGRVIPLDEEQEPTQIIIGVSFAEETPIPLGQQFSLDAPEGTYRLRFRVKDWYSQDPNLGWVLYVRRGDHVFHDVQPVETPIGTIDMPFPDEYDFSIDGEGDDFELELTLDSDPPLEPGATYYFSMASREIGALAGFYVFGEITVDGDVWIEEVDPADDDDAAGDDDDDGDGCQSCSSSVASGPAPAGLLGLLLGLVALGRRRP